MERVRTKQRTMSILIGVTLAVLVLFIVFLCRRPVIIVADMASVLIGGQARIRRETAAAAFSLFRPVKTLFLSDDADESIIPHSIAEISIHPYCVLFPLRFTRSAVLYRDINPSVPIVILEGRVDETAGAASLLGADFFIYKTDIETDLCTAGLAAFYIDQNNDTEENGRIVVFMENRMLRQGREAFLRAFENIENPPETVFLSSFSQYTEIPGLSCVVLAGTGGEFLENDPKIPLILFTWVDPNLIPDEAVLIFDDSPWAQATAAVRMASSGVEQGVIESRLIYKNSKKISREALRKLQK